MPRSITASPPRCRPWRSCRSAAAAVILGLAAVAAAAPQAGAETRTFFVANEADGYGIDECLASGASCGRSMASTFCRARDYGEAVSFRKAAPEDLRTEDVRKEDLREDPRRAAGAPACTAQGCFVIAIQCQR